MKTITIDGVQIPTDKLIAAGWKAPAEKKSVVWNPKEVQEATVRVSRRVEELIAKKIISEMHDDLCTIRGIQNEKK